jgi:hypothetical protein
MRATKSSLVGFAMALALTAALRAQSIAAPKVPDDLKAAADEHVVLLAHASGAQIYTCARNAMGAAAWVLKGPDARLRDGHDKPVGEHSIGPKWTYKDGSSITAKAVAHIDALDPNAIPWLKLQVTEHAGKGLFDEVTTVQRIRTHGGTAPDSPACTTANQNEQVSVPYTADYYFYAPALAPAP